MSPRPPANDDLVHVPVEAARDLLLRLLTTRSLFRFDAEIVTSRLIEADLRGLHAYGLAMTPRLLAALTAGDIDPRGRVLTLHETPALAVLDGSRAAGAVAATRGMLLAVAKARQSGVGTVVVGNSQSLGAASVYSLLAAREGLIGFVTSSTGGATVAAPGGMQGAVGNSPLSWAIPLPGRSPCVIDFCCGATSWRDVEAAAAAGVPLGHGIALDAEGLPTTDPVQARTLLPRGGTAGFGLAFVGSVLAGALAGGRLPIRKRRGDSAEDSQHFFQAIDPAAFADPERFAKELTQGMQEIRALPVRPGDPAVRFPGDEDEARAGRITAEGIPVSRETYDAILKAMP